MLSRVQSLSNPLNPNNNKQKRLITEPSQYLQQLQLLLSEKQKKLSETAQQMQKTVEKFLLLNLLKKHLNKNLLKIMIYYKNLKIQQKLTNYILKIKN
jgi:hypothetical protein